MVPWVLVGLSVALVPTPRIVAGLAPARSLSARMVDIPRITLPSALDQTFSDLDLKNPNRLSQADYNTYSGAAIAGTLALLVPGFFVFDVSGLVFDFLFSALLGGGLGAFLALRTDGIASTANDIGGKLLDAAGGVNIPRITLPDALDGTFSDFDLKNPNRLSQAAYNTYSGAAIAGTLALFLPGAIFLFDVSGFVFDFLFSALLGGGLGAFLALRKDGIASTANEIGGRLLAAVDKVVS
jgi:hypothetical protein